MSLQTRPAYLYGVGEDVVVRLDGVIAYSAGTSVVVAKRLPGWTIAQVVALTSTDGLPLYRIAFAHGHAAYTCTVKEEAIDGTA
jgi:hypothetical protein